MITPATPTSRYIILATFLSVLFYRSANLIGEETYSSDVVFIKGGTFIIGDRFCSGDNDELPHYEVTVNSFWIAKYETTQQEYLIFCNETQSNYPEWMEPNSIYNISTGTDGYYLGKVGYGKDRHPIVGVSWYNAIAFCNWKSEKEGLQSCYKIELISNNLSEKYNECSAVDTLYVMRDMEANGYRLPTETEWEYAASSCGKKYRFSWGNGDPMENLADETFVKKMSNYPYLEGYNDSFPYSSPVGSFKPNELGIYDMSGNVFEWCWDEYSKDYQNKRLSMLEGRYRVVRGGAWSTTLESARISNRTNVPPTCKGCNGGFRMVRSQRQN